MLLGDEDVDFIEPGDAPAPDDVEFIGEDEENDPEAVERARAERLKRRKSPRESN
jgi:hypothetical protein